MEETAHGSGASSEGGDGPECMAAVRTTEVSRSERLPKDNIRGLAECLRVC